MTRDRVLSFMQSPELLDRDSLAEIQHLNREFPFCQTLHLLLAKNLYNEKSIHYPKQLKIAASHVSDRKQLYRLITLETQEESKIEEESVEAAEIPIQETAPTVPEPVAPPVVEPPKQAAPEPTPVQSIPSEPVKPKEPEVELPPTPFPRTPVFPMEDPQKVANPSSTAGSFLNWIPNESEPISEAKEEPQTPPTQPKPIDLTQFVPVEAEEKPQSQPEEEEVRNPLNFEILREAISSSIALEAEDLISEEAEGPEIKLYQPVIEISESESLDTPTEEIDEEPATAEVTETEVSEEDSIQEEAVSEIEVEQEETVSEPEVNHEIEVTEEEPVVEQPDSEKITEEDVEEESEETPVFLQWLKSLPSSQTDSESAEEETPVQTEELEEANDQQEEVEETSDKGSTEELIDEFIRTEPSITPMKGKAEFFSPSKMAKRSLDEDETLISETLAKVYVQQGQLEKALKAYKQLSLKYPEKSSYFAALVSELEAQIKK